MASASLQYPLASSRHHLSIPWQGTSNPPASPGIPPAFPQHSPDIILASLSTTPASLRYFLALLSISQHPPTMSHCPTPRPTPPTPQHPPSGFCRAPGIWGAQGCGSTGQAAAGASLPPQRGQREPVPAWRQAGGPRCLAAPCHPGSAYLGGESGVLLTSLPSPCPPAWGAEPQKGCSAHVGIAPLGVE